MNVIVIVTDSLRADHVSCYGNKWIKTPNFESFSKNSMRVTHAYPEGLATIPVRTALLTGRYTLPFRGWQGLERGDILLPELLWGHGVKTAIIADTYHMHKPGMGFSRGFDQVHWIRGQESDQYKQEGDIDNRIDLLDKPHSSDPEHGRRLQQYFRNISNVDWEDERTHFVARVSERAVQWLEDESDEDPFFLWIDSFDPHEPWDPPEPYWSMYDDGSGEKSIVSPIYGKTEGYLSDGELNRVKSLYAGEITLVDKWIGKVFDKIRSIGHMSDTMVIWLSDHGEPLGEHGIVMKARPWPYEELIRIPLLVHHPDGHMDGKSVKGMVQTVDIMPTVLEFLNINDKLKAKGEHLPPIHGLSMGPLLDGEYQTLRKYAVSGYFKKSWSITDGNWKYITYLEEEATRYLACDITEHIGKGILDKKSGALSYSLLNATNGKEMRKSALIREPELYNLEKDPGEKINLLKQPDPLMEIGKTLELELRRFMDALIMHESVNNNPMPYFDFMGRLTGKNR